MRESHNHDTAALCEPVVDHLELTARAIVFPPDFIETDVVVLLHPVFQVPVCELLLGIHHAQMAEEHLGREIIFRIYDDTLPFLLENALFVQIE